MTTIEILSKPEISEFNNPPVFSASDRVKYFYLSTGIQEEISKVRLHKNRIGFVLQYGYFKATGQFFHPRSFDRKDINHVTQRLKLKSNNWKSCEYLHSQEHTHKQQILSVSTFVSFNAASKNLLIHEAESLASKNTKPRVIFEWLVSYLRKHKIEVPSYSPIAKIITNALNKSVFPASVYSEIR
jgi:hypothetical protein